MYGQRVGVANTSQGFIFQKIILRQRPPLEDLLKLEVGD